MPVPYLHHSGGTEHADPSLVRDLGHPHPGGEDPPPLRVQCRLGRVQVQAAVQELVHIRDLYPAGGLVKLHMKADRLVFLLLPVLKEAHGGEDQHLAPFRLKVVRALPHPAVLGSLECLVHVGPGVEVIAPVEEHLPVLFSHRAPEDEIPVVPALPDLGVPRVGPVADGRVRDGGDDHLFPVLVVKVKSVLRGDHELGGLKLIVQACVRVLRVHHLVPDAGVDKVEFAVLLHRAPGEAAVPVLPHGGVQGQIPVLPGYQIPAHRVSPVHGPPPGTIGEILIKQMVVSLVVDKAVGVVHPVVRRF